MIQHCCCPCNLSKRSLFILGSLESSLELGILLLSRSIYFSIAECFTSKLSIKSLSMSLYLLGIDKISNFSCSLLIVYLKTRFLRITIIQS